MMALLLWLLAPAWPAALPESFSWAGQGDVRVLVRIEPPVRGQTLRSGDEGPAEVILDFPGLLRQLGTNRLPDLTTVQVIRHDAATGAPLPQGKFAYGQSEHDVPWRWYDASIPYEFPEERRGSLDVHHGELHFATIPRLGYFFDCLGDWKAGRLVFLHRHSNTGPAWYGIYFSLLPDGAEPNTLEPRGWVGDGLHRCGPDGSSTTGLIHARVEVADWNNDGLFDLIVGCSRGNIVWYPNRGESGKPDFPFSRLLFTADGKPLDVGWTSTPKVVDWDGDGLNDLLSGTEWNRVVWYRNVGRRGRPVLEYQGLVRTEDGEPLHVPWSPSPETEPRFTYTRDYYPVLDTADWDGDGDTDLLAGGYVTGRIYFFENTAGTGRTPILKKPVELEADGEALDVIWAAAPAVADLDGDGDLDLLSGCMPVTAGGGDSASSEHFVHFFRNDGSRNEPRLHETPLPHRGRFPRASLGTPRVVDWSNDGVLDLVVSAGTDIYLYRNVGSSSDPVFEAHAQALPSRWGNAPLSANQFLDWDGDGLIDAVNAPTVALNTGRGNPGVFSAPFSVLRKEQVISHRSGIGDDWVYQRLYDLDGDGRVDLMDADHAGHFWWHRNRGSAEKPDLHTEGVQLLLTDGAPAIVGEGREGFDDLQGARATYTVADFDGDEAPDVIASDTFGAVWYFRQAAREREGAIPRFEPPIRIGKLPNRASPCAADFNGDGKMDAIIATNPENTLLFLNRGAAQGPPFEEPRRLELPEAPFGAGGPVMVADYNGDGDADIVLTTAYGYTCWYEHTFIEAGYVRAAVDSVQQRP